MAEQNVDIDVPAEGTGKAPQLPSAAATADFVGANGQIDLDRAVQHLTELCMAESVPIGGQELMAVLQEAHERSIMWLANILFRTLAEMGALPDGYEAAMAKALMAVEFFRVAALYDFITAKKQQAAAVEAMRRKSQGFEEPELPFEEPDADPA